MNDERFKQLMVGVGMPNSRSLLIALRQVENEITQEIKSPAALEKLAELEHEQWAHWTKYMLENLTPKNINRWIAQTKIPYANLTDAEKDLDRKWARKALDAI